MKSKAFKIVAGVFVAAIMATSVCAFAACGGGDDDDDNNVHVHTLTHTEAKDATYDEEGNIEYWYCTGCGKYFSDANGTNQIYANSITIPKLEVDDSIICVWTGGAYQTGADEPTLEINFTLYRDATFYLELVGMNNYGTGTWSYNDDDGLALSDIDLPLAGMEVTPTVTVEGDVVSISAAVALMGVEIRITGSLSDLKGLTISGGTSDGSSSGSTAVTEVIWTGTADAGSMGTADMMLTFSNNGTVDVSVDIMGMTMSIATGSWSYNESDGLALDLGSSITYEVTTESDGTVTLSGSGSYSGFEYTFEVPGNASDLEALLSSGSAGETVVATSTWTGTADVEETQMSFDFVLTFSSDGTVSSEIQFDTNGFAGSISVGDGTWSYNETDGLSLDIEDIEFAITTDEDGMISISASFPMEWNGMDGTVDANVSGDPADLVALESGISSGNTGSDESDEDAVQVVATFTDSEEKYVGYLYDDNTAKVYLKEYEYLGIGASDLEWSYTDGELSIILHSGTGENMTLVTETVTLDADNNTASFVYTGTLVKNTDYADTGVTLTCDDISGILGSDDEVKTLATFTDSEGTYVGYLYDDNTAKVYLTEYESLGYGASDLEWSYTDGELSIILHSGTGENMTLVDEEVTLELDSNSASFVYTGSLAGTYFGGTGSVTLTCDDISGLIG